MKRRSEADILMVGLVPPPYHGQAVMTRALFDSDLRPLRVATVEARYNRHLEEVSSFRPGKVLELGRVLGCCLWVRLRTGARVLYYTPGSAAVVPFLKDVLFLTLARPFFGRTLLHYHSGGLPEFLESRWWLRALGRWTYGRGSWAIALTDRVPVPGGAFGAARELVIPNAIASLPPMRPRAAGPADAPIRLVFLGNLYREKGIFDAVDACVAAAEKMPDRRLRLRVAGAPPDEKVKEALRARLRGLPSNLDVSLLGTVGPEAKWDLLQESDLMLFPSFYGSENFPLVLLEAMACGLPVIATRWRGIPSMVTEGRTGVLVDVGDVSHLAKAIVDLSQDTQRRLRLGKEARATFETRYAWPSFLENIKACFREALQSSGRKGGAPGRTGRPKKGA